LECIADKQAESVTSESKDIDVYKQSDRVLAKLNSSSREESEIDASRTDDAIYVPVKNTRTLEKAYQFLRMNLGIFLRSIAFLSHYAHPENNERNVWHS